MNKLGWMRNLRSCLGLRKLWCCGELLVVVEVVVVVVVYLSGSLCHRDEYFQNYAVNALPMSPTAARLVQHVSMNFSDYPCSLRQHKSPNRIKFIEKELLILGAASKGLLSSIPLLFN